MSYEPAISDNAIISGELTLTVFQWRMLYATLGAVAEMVQEDGTLYSDDVVLSMSDSDVITEALAAAMQQLHAFMEEEGFPPLDEDGEVDFDRDGW